MHEAANHYVRGPILGCILRIFAEERLIAVGAGADGAFKRVEGFLTSLGCGNIQPIQSGIRVLGALRQHEAVREEVEDAIGAWGDCPVEIDMGGQSKAVRGCVGEIAISPVAHDVEGGIAIGDHLGSGLPIRQGGSVGIGVGQGLGEVLQAEGHIRASPISGGRGGPEAIPGICADGADHDILEQVNCSPGSAEGQAGLASGNDLVADSEEGIPCGEVGLRVGGNASGSKNLGVVPENVGAVNVYRHAVGMSILGDQGEQGGGQNSRQTCRSKEIVQGQNLISCNVIGNRFLTSMCLPGIRGIASGEAGGQNGFGVGASTTGYGGVDEFNTGIQAVEDLDHGGQTIGFAGTNPPGEYFNLGAGRRSSGGCSGGRTAGREDHDGGYQDSQKRVKLLIHFFSL